MRFENYLDFQSGAGKGGLFFAVGSFGVIDGAADYSREQADGCVTFRQMCGNVALTATFTDLNLNVGPIQRYYTVYTMDFYGNISEEDLQTVMVYTVGK
jgi:hypothetical protein